MYCYDEIVDMGGLWKPFKYKGFVEVMQYDPF